MSRTLRTLRTLVVPFGLAVLIAAGCGDSDNDDSGTPDDSGAAVSTTDADSPGIRLVSAQDGADLQADPPEDLVILDVRTTEEFEEGHLEGALMIDFYRDDFADRVADLDPDVPYLVYCRSGNRSGQTIAIMEELGFTDVADVDGGIVSWLDAGLPTIAP